MRVSEAFDGSVVAEAQLRLARRPRWGELVLAVPLEQRSAELSAVGEHPGVELDVV